MDVAEVGGIPHPHPQFSFQEEEVLKKSVWMGEESESIPLVASTQTFVEQPRATL